MQATQTAPSKMAQIMAQSRAPESVDILAAFEADLDALALRHVTPRDGEWPGTSHKVAVEQFEAWAALKMLKRAYSSVAFDLIEKIALCERMHLYRDNEERPYDIENIQEALNEFESDYIAAGQWAAQGDD